jgi:hypothetical protein
LSHKQLLGFLKGLAALLLLVNLSFLAYTYGLGAALGWLPANPSEPQRLNAQVQAESLHILSAVPVNRAQPVLGPAPAAASAAEEAPAPMPPTAYVPGDQPPSDPVQAKALSPEVPPSSCKQSQVLSKSRLTKARQALEAMAAPPKGATRWEDATEPDKWIIYLGRFANDEALARKTQQLEQMDMSFEVLDDAELSPGVSVGTYPTQADAVQALTLLNRRGLRLARVIKWSNSYNGQRLVVANMDPAWELPLQESGFILRACPPPAKL